MIRYWRNTSGQMFLVVGMMLLLLIGTIPMMMFLTRTNAVQRLSQTKRAQALSIAESGIAYGMRQLSPETTWNNAMGNGTTGNFGALYGSPDCNSGNVVTLPGGGAFKLRCTRSATLAPNIENDYQVAIKATAYMPKGNTGSGSLEPTRALMAYVSRRTLAATLPNGTQAAAALQLGTHPTTNGNLVVHWGPIAVYQTSITGFEAWTLTGVLNGVDTNADSVNDYQGFPRKFTNGPITGSGGGLFTRLPGWNDQAFTTDQYEYWAFASMQVPPLVSLSTYKALAMTQTDPPGPGTGDYVGNQHVSSFSSGACHSTSQPGNSNYIALGDGCSFQLEAGPPGGIGGTSESVIYIESTATRPPWPPTATVTIALNNILAKAIIIDGNAVINVTGATTPRTLRVPTTANKEYLVITEKGGQTSYMWPCRDAANAAAVTPTGKTCTSDGTMSATQAGIGNINYEGFLYVGGNLQVSSNWAMSGALMVGDITQAPTTGTLTIDAGRTLTLMYNPKIGREITVDSKELGIDHMVEAAAE